MSHPVQPEVMPLVRFTARRALLLIAVLIIILGCTLFASSDEDLYDFGSWGEQAKKPRDYSQLFQNYPLQEPIHKPAEADRIRDLTPPAFVSLEDAHKLCGSVKLRPFLHRDRHRKVYDLFIVGTELDWVEIRLETLAAEVDYFVILEATMSFTKTTKPLYFKKNWHRFAKFESKIIYHALNDDGAIDAYLWDREHYQRDALFTQVFPSLLGTQAPQDGDVLIVSDVDEIPRPETISKLRNCDFPDRTSLMSRFFLYSFAWRRADMDWYHPQATIWQGNKTILPESLRMESPDFAIQNASWHCTSCFHTVAEFVTKIQSFSHIEYNKPEFKDPDAIVRRVRNGSDLFDRGFNYVKVPQVELDMPDFLRQHSDRFRYLIDRDPADANFDDYISPRS